MQSTRGLLKVIAPNPFRNPVGRWDGFIEPTAIRIESGGCFGRRAFRAHTTKNIGARHHSNDVLFVNNGIPADTILSKTPLQFWKQHIGRYPLDFSFHDA
jgi:hypothetical protein